MPAPPPPPPRAEQFSGRQTPGYEAAPNDDCAPCVAFPIPSPSRPPAARAVPPLRLRPAAETMRVKHLLSETSGIGYEMFSDLDEVFGDWGCGDVYAIANALRRRRHPCVYRSTSILGADLDLAEFCDVLSAAGVLVCEPGTFSYGLGATVLGRVIEVAYAAHCGAHRKLSDIFAELLFRPLRLESAAFFLPDGDPRARRLPTLYGATVAQEDVRSGDFVAGRRVEVTVVRAERLGILGLGLDPVCVLRYGGREHATATVAKSRSPEWGETFVCPVENAEERLLRFEVKDATNLIGPEVLGRCTFNAGQLLLGQSREATVALQPEEGAAFYRMGDRGTLTVRAVLVAGDDAGAAPAGAGEGAATPRARVQPPPGADAWRVGRRVRVTVVEGLKLIAADPIGFSDPYCRVRLGSATETTAVVKKSLDPKWGQTFTFPIESAGDRTLHFEVLDSDNDKRDDADDVLGHGAYDAGDPCLLPLNRGVEKVVALRPEKGASIYKNKQRGHLRLKVEIVDEAVDAEGDVPAEAGAGVAVAETGGVGGAPEGPGDAPEPFRAGSQVRVTVVEAKKLGLFGLTDPYCVVRLGAETHRTAAIRRTRDPQWNETFVFTVADAEDRTLSFAVNDSGPGSDSDEGGGGDDLLGQCTYDAGRLACGQARDETLVLRPHARASFLRSNDQGDLKVRLELVEAPAAEAAAPPEAAARRLTAADLDAIRNAAAATLVRAEHSVPACSPRYSNHTDHFAGPRRYESGDTGCLMTLQDYAKFLDCLLRGGVAADGTRLLSVVSAQLLCGGRLQGLNLDVPLAKKFGLQGALSPFPQSFNFGWATTHDEAPVSAAGPTDAKGCCHWSGYASTHVRFYPKEDAYVVIGVQLMANSVGVSKFAFPVLWVPIVSAFLDAWR